MDLFEIDEIQFEEIPEQNYETSEENNFVVDDLQFEEVLLETVDFDESLTFESEEIEVFEATCIDLFQTLYLAGLPRDTLNSVNKSVLNLFDVACSLVEKKFGDGGLTSIQACFRTFSQMILQQSTEFKRCSQMERSEFYVEPVPVVYGSKFTKIRKGNRSIHINKPLVMYTVPIENTIKALFKSNIFRTSYNNNDHQCQTGMYTSFCCSHTCNNGSFSPLNQPNSLKIQLYCDGVNLADALKQNANDHRLGAVYFKILNQQQNVLSQLQNIHLVGE